MNYQYQYSHKITLDWVVKNMPQFLFPDLSRKKDRIKKPFSGVLASLDQKPIGLILATFDQSGLIARVHSFIVHPDHRGKGVGATLLRELEKNLLREECRQVEGYFREHWRSLKYLKKILEKQGWTSPKEELVVVRGEAVKVTRLFMDDRLVLPEGYRFMPFSALSRKEKERIKEKKRTKNWYPDYLDPFIYENTINTATSLILKYREEVVGWVVSHLITKELNEFTNLFLDQAHRSYKLAHLLMRETINLQVATGTPYFLITSKANDNPMARFLIRHAPHTGVFFTKSLRSAKILT